MTASPNRPTLAAVNKLLRSITLDERGETVASVAKQLAKTLDDAAGATSGAGVSALAGLSKELQATLEKLVPATNTKGRQIIAALRKGHK
jgi:hypothetical protein